MVSPAPAIEDPQNVNNKAGIDAPLGKSIDLGLTFTDRTGRKTTLKELINPNRPVLLTPVYYGCPRLCGLLLSGTVKLINELELKLGSDYQILTISFDPDEGSDLAVKRSEEFYQQLKNSERAPGNWHFLTGDSANIDPLMTQIGFRYQRDGEEYAHTAAIIVLTPEGEISQYFTGIDFAPWDMKMALVEAAKGRIGSVIDHVLLFCFRFDHTKGKYTWAAFSVMRAGGVLTLLTLAAVIFYSARSRLTRMAN